MSNGDGEPTGHEHPFEEGQTSTGSMSPFEEGSVDLTQDSGISPANPESHHKEKPKSKGQKPRV